MKKLLFAKTMFCGESKGFQSMMGSQLMQRGMMGFPLMPGMMFDSSSLFGTYWLVWNALVLILLVGLVVLVVLGILKLVKDLTKR